MPRVLEHDPAWLSVPAPAAQLFEASSEAQQPPGSEDGPTALRTIAHRGTEIFVAVGKEVRWADLAALKDAHSDGDLYGAQENSGQEAERSYRILKTPVARRIVQLSVSPSGNYMAIITSHTCHVCVLPESSHLQSRDNSSLRLKTFQVGPTAHVLEQAPLVSALWHPLSPEDCLVTVSQNACVRLWEIDAQNRASFDEPALAIDLKKLANATSAHTDFSASKYGVNKGFSPDDVEMLAAAACFGGEGLEDEHGWASMTLWIAMTEGDVYALCPFLPSRWKAPQSLLPSLSTSVMAKSRAINRDAEVSENEKRQVDQQKKWLADVDAQDFDELKTYLRPNCLNAVPKLQGPYQLTPAPEFGEVTDIHVIAPKVDEYALYDDADQDEDEDGLSVGIICLATTTNEVHVCLATEAVEAEWLPSKRSRSYTLDDADEERELLLFETIDVAQAESEDDGYPTFSPSPIDRYELFVTHPTGVSSLSFRPWVDSLEAELSAPSSSGAALRLDLLFDSTRTSVDQPVDLPPSAAAATALAIADPSLGYLLLTSANNTPFSSVLSFSSPDNPFAPDDTPLALPPSEPRTPYRPAPEFSQPSALPALLKNAAEKNLLGSAGDATKSQVRFSPATLQLLTEAHRIMSSETHRLGVAAAELFRQCERMRAELREQVRKVAEVAQRVDVVTGNEEDAEAEEDEEDKVATGPEKIERRMDAVREKSGVLNERFERLRRKVGRLGGRELSAREKAFQVEVARLEKSVLPPSENGEAAAEEAAMSPGGSTLVGRMEAVEALQRDLLRQVEEAVERLSKASGEQREKSADGGSVFGGVGSQYRKQKLAQVMEMLERETALVEAVMERLQRLQRGG